MTTDVVEPGKLDIGRVITETFQVIGRNIATVGILTLILSGLPTAIALYLEYGMMKSRFAGLAAGTIDFDTSAVGGIGAAGLAALIGNAILQGAIIYTTVQDLSGQKPTLGDAVATGLRNFLPLIGLTILLVLALICGFILLVVPGIMLLCAWIVAVPALIADRSGVFGAFGRSAELTRGNRWLIFGLLVIIWVVSIVLGTIFNAVIGVGAMGPGGNLAALEKLLTPTALALAVIRQTIVSVVASVGVAVLYVELRKARETMGPQWLSEIFA